MRAAPIGELFKIIGGKPAPKGEDAFSDQGTPFVKMKDLGRAHFSNNLIDIEQKVGDQVAKKNGLNLIKRGSILLPRSGSVALNHRAVLGVDAYMVSHICALEVIENEKINNIYAYYYLRSIKMNRISKKTTGLDAITFEDLGKINIPLPPLGEQIRIAYLLSKVEGLIAQRKQHLKQLDDLLKSVFLEMFGDPLTNPYSFQKIDLSQIATKEKNSIVDGPFGSSIKQEDYRETGIPIIRINNIRPEGFWAEDFKYISESKYKELSRSKVRKNDILMARVGHTIGKTCIFDREFKALLSTTGVCKITIDTAVANINFTLSQLNLPQYIAYIKSHVAGGGQPYLNLSKIKAFKVIVPPRKLQEQFANTFEKVEGIRTPYQQSLTNLENLYGALSQKAFKGELDLSRVILPIEQGEPTEEQKTVPSVIVELPQTIMLPAPDDLQSLLSAEGRKAVIEKWLDSYLGQLGSSVFSADSFMEAAQQSLWELQEAGAPEQPNLGVAEYDQLKTWVFEQVGSGKLKQTKNIISINGKRKFGNKVILRARQTRL